LEAERARAIATSGSARQVAAAMGVPRRTVSFWRRQDAERQHTGATPIVEATREELGRALWQGVTTATDAVRRGLDDPKARLSDKARALEVLLNPHQLLVCESTAIVSSINVDPTANVDPELSLAWEERDQLREWLDSHPELLAHGLAIREANRE
jgi:hypothetical protein